MNMDSILSGGSGKKKNKNKKKKKNVISLFDVDDFNNDVTNEIENENETDNVSNNKNEDSIDNDDKDKKESNHDENGGNENQNGKDSKDSTNTSEDKITESTIPYIATTELDSNGIEKPFINIVADVIEPLSSNYKGTDIMANIDFDSFMIIVQPSTICNLLQFVSEFTKSQKQQKSDIIIEEVQEEVKENKKIKNVLKHQ